MIVRTNLIADMGLRTLTRALNAAMRALDGRLSTAKISGDVRIRAALSVERTLLDAWQTRVVPQLSTILTKGVHLPAARAAVATARDVPQLSAAWGKEAVNPWAVRWSNQHAGRLVTRMTAEQQAVVRQATTRVMRSDWSVQQATRHLKGTIGLNRQGEARLARLASSGASDARLERFRARLIAERAETIARTETVAAANQGQLQAWREAVLRGYLPATAAKEWTVTADDRLCPVCAPMSGEIVPLMGLFSGGVEGPPRHPRCRCAIIARPSTKSPIGKPVAIEASADTLAR